MFDLYSAIYAILIAFILNIILCPVLIPGLTKLKFGQQVRDDGPKSHLVKSGTPTMGGIMILLSFLIASLFFVRDNSQITSIKYNLDAVMILFVTIGYGVIGFFDDLIKITKKRSMGLRAWQKMLAQIIITTIFLYYIYNYSGIDTSVYIPFTEGKTLNLGYVYIPFFYVVMVGTVNSVNLTDGLDGLAAGVTLLVSVFFLLTAWAANSGIVPVCGAAVGALLGFLLFNAYPARVFMGDTGSLALGGFIASIAVILKMPIFLLIVGIIYVLETLSVILQVGYFKLTNGKRLFKMAPLHHHFEQCGWKETRVVALFYVITAISCLIGFLGAKYLF